MASVTAKQVKRIKDKTGQYPNLQELTRGTQSERKAIQKALAGYTVAMFDIEATSLNASFGYTLCASVKPVGRVAKLFSIHTSKGYAKQPWNDRQLAVSVRNALEDCDLIITWNGQEYDLPFLDQRLTIHNERRIGAIHHIDLLPIARRKLRMHSNRLDAVAETLEVETSKTGLKPAIWQKASTGDRKALQYVIDHNLADVQVLEEVFLKLKSYIDVIYRKR